MGNKSSRLKKVGGATARRRGAGGRALAQHSPDERQLLRLSIAVLNKHD